MGDDERWQQGGSNVTAMMRSTAAVAVALSSLLAAAAPAMARPEPDPHMPNVQTGYCPAGRGMQPLQVAAIYCDGVPYADGSRWRYVQFPVPPDMPNLNVDLRSMYGLHCVVGDAVTQSSLAPPGGCNGAV